MAWTSSDLDLALPPVDAGPSVPAKLLDCVELKRAEFMREHNLKKLRDEQRQLQSMILGFPKHVRHRVRELWTLKEKSDALATRIKRVESGEAKAEFERRVAPYVREYERLCERDTATDAGPAGAAAAGSAGSAPGSKRKRSSAAAAAAHPTAGGGSVRHGRATASVAAARRYDRSALRDEFVTHMMGAQAPLLVENRDMCDTCGVAMVVLATEALLACPKCSRTRLYVQTTSQQIAYGEEVRDFASFSYKRHNHFQDWLNAFQAKESAEVPPSIIERVMAELYTRRLNSLSQINSKRVREILKDLRLRKYYDHTAQITTRITGKPPPRMTPQQEEQCRLMFRAVEAAFEVHCPPGRRNFLSYSYCLHRFVELLGWRQFLPCFTLLKGKDKLAKQDQIFKAICADLDWEFIPTI